jgi:hypothetical protein
VSPESSGHLLRRRPMWCPDVKLSAAKQRLGVSRCSRRPPLRAPHHGQAAPVHLHPRQCILGPPHHCAHLTGISNRANSRLMDPSPAPPSGRSCTSASNHVGWDSSSTSDQIEFHAPLARPSAWLLPRLTADMPKSAVPSPMVGVSAPKKGIFPCPSWALIRQATPLGWAETEARQAPQPQSQVGSWKPAHGAQYPFSFFLRINLKNSNKVQILMKLVRI